MNIHLAVVLVYSAGLIALGVVIGRRVRTSESFFVAGRKLGPLLLFGTLLAANIGAGSTMGAAGIGYREGIVAAWWVGSAGIGTLILAFWVGPRIWKIAAEKDLRTVGDFLELRYGSLVRGIVAALLWVATLFVLAAQLVAVSFVLAAVAGIPTAWGCLIGGVVMTTYFTAGGLLSSAWVNLVQLVVLFVGFVVAVPVALSTVGGLEGLIRASSEIDARLVNPWRSEIMFVYLAALVPAFIVSPGLLQKVYGARDARTVRLAVAAAGVALLVFASLPPLLGMMARVHHPELESPGLALPMLLLNQLPLAIGSLALAAIFSAELSSADAVLFMLATSLSRDLYQRFLRPDATDGEVLRVARLAALSGGVLGIGLALAFGSIIAPLTIFYSILSVSLFVPVIAGLHTRLSGAPEALAAIGVGVGALLAVHLATGGSGYGPWNPTLIGLVVSAAGFVVVMAARWRTVKSAGGV